MSDNPFTLLRAWTVGHCAEDEAVLLRMVTIDGEAVDVLLPAEAAAEMGEAITLAAIRLGRGAPLSS